MFCSRLEGLEIGSDPVNIDVNGVLMSKFWNMKESKKFSRSLPVDEETQNAFDILDESHAANSYVENLVQGEEINTDTEKELVYELIQEMDGRTWEEVEVECHGEIVGSVKGKDVCFCETMELTYQGYLNKWVSRKYHVLWNKKVGGVLQGTIGGEVSG